MSDLVKEFSKETKDNKNMDTYTPLLRSVITHLGGIGEELGIDSLAMPGGTRLVKKDLGAAYELISFLIVK